MSLSAEHAALLGRHGELLKELTATPTAAGKESRVIDRVRRWVDERPELVLHEDAAGNLVISRHAHAAAVGEKPHVFFTAHLDHPAFVVIEPPHEGELTLAFLGGVMDPYFDNARVVVHDEAGGAHHAALAGRCEMPEGAAASFYKTYRARLASDDAGAIAAGDVAVWDLPPPAVEDGLLRTNACDDLAALAAALAAYDELLREKAWPGPVSLLFTRAEEVGFLGAIAACRAGTIPRGAKLVALENSRSYAESPIGGGPIVRVGDKMSVFSPSLTADLAACCETLAKNRPGWKWQRRLMPGGSCEATVFCAYGHEATCLCLPLGNYHNMGNLERVQAGDTSAADIEREFIALCDFAGLVELLVAYALTPGASPGVHATRGVIDKLWAERAFILEG